MSLPVFTNILMAVIALSALLLNYVSVKRHRTLDNENHFFRYKIDQYQQIITSADDLLDLYDQKADEADLELSMKKPEVEVLNNLADEIDLKTEEFRKNLNKYCLFIPEHILNALEGFYDSLYAEILEDEEFEKIDKILDEHEKKLDKIINLMRKDIGVDELNYRLTKRIKH